MSIGFDPKITGVIRKEDLLALQEGVTAPQKPVAREAMEKPKMIAQPDAAATHPSRQVSQTGIMKAPSALEREVARIREGLHGSPAESSAAATQALKLASSYSLRRSRGARHQGVSLCEELAGAQPGLRRVSEQLRMVLAAEGQIHELAPQASAEACRKLLTLLDDAEEEAASGHDKSSDAGVAALMRATLAHGLTQMAIHFPAELARAGIEAGEALRRALELAEEAIALAPELPDGHSALGRVVLSSDAEDALTDAHALFQHALTLDPEHDPAASGLAAVHLARGEGAQALELAEKLIKHGNGLPHALLLRALVLAHLGRADEALRDADRAVHMAPQAGLLQLDAARIAELAHQPALAAEYRQRARDLLEDSFPILQQATTPDEGGH